MGLVPSPHLVAAQDIRVPITGPPPAYLVGGDQAFVLPAFGPQPLESAEVVGSHAGEPMV